MFIKIRATENYQVMETEIEVESIKEAAIYLRELRNAILVATKDVEAKKKPSVEEKINQAQKSNESNYRQVPLLSQYQKDYLLRLGQRLEDIQNLTREEASSLITKLTSR